MNKINKGDIEDAIFELNIIVMAFRGDKEYVKIVKSITDTIKELELKKTTKFNISI